MWRAIGVGDLLARSLVAANLPGPTRLQVQVVPTLLRGGDGVVCAETGSGKTLAYLLPFLARLSPASDVSDALMSPPLQLPCGLVLVPSSELAVQVGRMFDQVARHLPTPLRSAVVTAGPVTVDATTALIVGTPARLLRHGALHLLPRCVFAAVDEVDQLLADPRAAADVWSVLHCFRAPHTHSRPLPGYKPPPRAPPPPSAPQAQLVFAGATLAYRSSKSPLALLQQQFPGAVLLQSPGAHHALPHVTQQFVRVQPDDRHAALLRALPPAPARTLCFVNSKHAVLELVNWLKFRGIKGGLHAGVALDHRLQSLADFRDGHTPVLVATDLAARGLDLPVDVVVQHDFAQDATIYLHRAGRTGRAGRPGRVLCFVTPADEPLADAIARVTSATIAAQAQSLASVFSRNRSFRKSLRKQQ